MIKVVSCFWNAENYIEKCINSVKNQTYKDFKMFLVDDVSTDKTVEIVKSVISGDERFVNMKNGDAVIYKGCEREHWRYPLESKYNRLQRVFKKDDTYHHQIFFHYVNANGPYLPFAFDRT